MSPFAFAGSGFETSQSVFAASTKLGAGFALSVEALKLEWVRWARFALAELQVSAVQLLAQALALVC